MDKDKSQAFWIEREPFEKDSDDFGDLNRHVAYTWPKPGTIKTVEYQGLFHLQEILSECAKALDMAWELLDVPDQLQDHKWQEKRLQIANLAIRMRDEPAALGDE